MPKITHITVSAPEGRCTPIHREDGVEPGGAPLRIVAGKVGRVVYSQTIRRAIARGDLFPCDMDGRRVESATMASAPRDLLDRKPAKEPKEPTT